VDVWLWILGFWALDVGCLGSWPSAVGGQLVSGFAWQLFGLQMLQK